jgi:hypothetical protein
MSPVRHLSITCLAGSRSSMMRTAVRALCRGLDIASRTRRNCLCTQGIEGMLSLGMGLAVMTLIC